MKRISILITCLIVYTVCFSKNISIDVSKPYSSGTTSIDFSSDSISFTNGVILQRFIQLQTVLEWYGPTYCGIKIDGSTQLLESGFKKTKLSNWVKYDTIQFFSNSDTVWSEIQSFPDSFTHFDSLWNYVRLNNADTLPAWGKWLFAIREVSDRPRPYSHTTISIVPCFSNILYFKTKTNKMKLQMKSIQVHADTISFSDGFSIINLTVDTINLNWAVDSLGNGKFTDLTNIKNTNKPSGRIKTQPPFRLRNGGDLKIIQNSGDHVSFFDIRGRQTLMAPNDPCAVPGGVLIYKIDGDKSSTFGKVIVK